MLEHQFDGAMRLYSQNNKVPSYNSRQPHRLEQQGAENMWLVVGHGQIGPVEQVQREHVQVAQIPKDMGNWGGLADVSEVYTRQESSWPSY